MNVNLGRSSVGQDQPAYIIAELGINHNGDIDIAKKLIDIATVAGCDAVKFQKRTPELCVPPAQQSVLRETPWGLISYLDYRYKVEFGQSEFDEIDAYCHHKGIGWFASAWDEPSVEFLERYDPPCFKVPSAALTDRSLLKTMRSSGRPLMLSTGMSTMDEIDSAIEIVGFDRLLLAHSTSTYPCPPPELNLLMIPALSARFDCPVGYSGHEVGLQTTIAAVVLGATFIERHVTLDRAMWGTDQAASVEPGGLLRLVRDIRTVEAALGDGIKRVYDDELPVLKKLRRVQSSTLSDPT
jgi:N-acetylneuraminate synthase